MSLLRRPPTLKMAPPGSHVVKQFVRISEKGVKYYVKAHIRKNRGSKIVLLPEKFFTFTGMVISSTQSLELCKVILNIQSSIRSFNFG